MTHRRTAAALCATALTGALSCGDSTGPPALASVEIAPGTATVLVAEQRQFAASARSLSGDLVTNASISWRSTADLIATVSPGGLVTGVNAGDALIIASSGGLSDTSTVTVIPVTFPPTPVATVDVQPVDSLEIETGASATLQATPRSATGFPLANRVIVWSTADPTTVEITTDGTITAVKPGRVTISATSEGKTGTTLAISVQPPRDFAISDAHITQNIQRADQSIPIVQGNHAAINVLLTATPIKTFPMDVMLRITDAGGALLYADTVEPTASTPGSATFAAPRAQFLIADTLVRAGVSWQVTRDPRGRVADDDASNDVFPPAGPRAINVVFTPPMHVRFVNIRHSNTLVNPAGGFAGRIYLPVLNSVFPLDTVLTSVRSGFLNSTTPYPGDIWGPALEQVDLTRMLENAADPNAYWYGVFSRPGGVEEIQFPADMPTGLSYIPSDPAANGAGTRTAVGIGLFWGGFESQFTTAAAHEIGHNLGLADLPCGEIGVIGHDVFRWARGQTPTAITQPASTLDIMSPCGVPRWVSEFAYLGVLNWRGYTTPSAAQRAPIAQRANTPVTQSLIVRGRVSETGAIEVDPAFVTDARAMRPERRGPFRVEVRAADGRLLLAEDFSPSVLSRTRAGHFLFALPIDASVESEIASIEVRGPSSSARRVRSMQPASTALRITTPAVRRVSAGNVEVACANPGAQGILIRDASTGSLLGVARSATATIDASAGESVVVTCSDGVASHSTTVVVR